MRINRFENSHKYVYLLLPNLCSDAKCVCLSPLFLDLSNESLEGCGDGVLGPVLCRTFFGLSVGVGGVLGPGLANDSSVLIVQSLIIVGCWCTPCSCVSCSSSLFFFCSFRLPDRCMFLVVVWRHGGDGESFKWSRLRFFLWFSFVSLWFPTN